MVFLYTILIFLIVNYIAHIGALKMGSVGTLGLTWVNKNGKIGNILYKVYIY